MAAKSSTEHRVAVLTYPDLCTFEFGIALEVFALPRPELDVDWYRCRVCADTQQASLSAMGGFTFTAPYDLQALDWADTIVVPGWQYIDAPVSAAITNALRAAHTRGARLVSICSGVQALAAAGLLSGLQATTHWRYVERMRQAYPDVEWLDDTLYVDTGQVLTSAGSAAGLDLCMHIVRQDYGQEVANQVARRLVIATHREGGQRQFIPAPVASDDRALGPLLDLVRADLATPHSVASMATLAHCSARTLNRRFRAATGMAPATWLTSERIKQARRLLETTQLNTEQVAARCGFGSVASLRHHFRRALGVAPARYRSAFAH